MYKPRNCAGVQGYDCSKRSVFYPKAHCNLIYDASMFNVGASCAAFALGVVHCPIMSPRFALARHWVLASVCNTALPTPLHRKRRSGAVDRLLATVARRPAWPSHCRVAITCMAGQCATWAPRAMPLRVGLSTDRAPRTALL